MAESGSTRRGLKPTLVSEPVEPLARDQTQPWTHTLPAAGIPQ
jgi:hypothetical protein